MASYLSFIKQYENVEWNVAHIFEHAIILYLEKCLETQGFEPSLAACITGESFEKVIFLRAKFYNDQAAAVFSKKLQSTILEEYWQDSIRRALGMILCEERSVVESMDKKLFKENILSLLSTPWVATKNIVLADLDIIKLKATGPVIILKNSPSNYHLANISLRFSAVDLTQLAVLCRLHVILTDYVISKLLGLYNLYEIERSGLDRDGGEAQTGFSIIHERDLGEDHLYRSLSKILAELTSNDAKIQQIQLQLKEWSRDDSVDEIVSQYYAESGVLVNNQDIYRYASTELIKQILQNTKPVVQPAKSF